MVEHLNNIIVINLESDNKSDELATDEGLQASTTNELDNHMEKGTLVDDDNPNVYTDNTIHDFIRSQAIQMKS